MVHISLFCIYVRFFSNPAVVRTDNVFCVLEDPAAPMRGDYLAQVAEYARTQPGASLPPPTHFRHTFPTLGPPGALEQLLTQLRARWVPEP